jgi:hypothetical protein
VTPHITIKSVPETDSAHSQFPQHCSVLLIVFLSHAPVVGVEGVVLNLVVQVKQNSVFKKNPPPPLMLEKLNPAPLTPRQRLVYFGFSHSAPPLLGVKIPTTPLFVTVNDRNWFVITVPSKSITPRKLVMLTQFVTVT